MSGYTVLLLEDDPSLGQVLRDHLQMQGMEVTLCADGELGLVAYRKSQYDLCLVDIMMPKKDGFTFAREIRQTDKKIPLIFLTARSMKEDKIEGFRIGCDDYITKPFSIEELMLRIEAVMRRSGAGDEVSTVFEIGEYRFDCNRQVLMRGDSRQKLTDKESDLLRLLCLHKNQIVTREEALKRIWEDDSYFTGRSMDVFISRLRKYLKDDPTIEIKGVHGKGFRLIVG